MVAISGSKDCNFVKKKLSQLKENIEFANIFTWDLKKRLVCPSPSYE